MGYSEELTGIELWTIGLVARLYRLACRHPKKGAGGIFEGADPLAVVEAFAES
jgi:hypothetical protein